MSSSRLRRSTGTTIWSSMNTNPHRIESLSNTGLYPSGVVSLSSRLMLALTLVSSRSMAVFEISVFRSSINSNSAFFIVSSVIFLFPDNFPTIWFIWIQCASFPSVLNLLRSTIGKLSPLLITLSSSVSGCSGSISPSSGFSVSSTSSASGWYPPQPV